ncbi:hypothetical protein AB0M97_17495 [Streptomyces sp. NPDC051207]|uniref:hypothetical protein n=1 Tax=Streptomyces sp. NPDC051207 TaxID=3154641 RepID=UPI0034358667
MTTEQQHQREIPGVLAAPPPPVPPAPAAPPAAPGDRRVLRAVLRWTSAVVVFAAVGASTAYGITRMERTDVPGLATASDGRWDYPTLVSPPRPAGSPGPVDPSNPAGTHYADLRELVLPAPEGAEQDRALRGADGWLATKDFLAEWPDKKEREEFGDDLTETGLRHIAARGWRMPDGTHTRIYLLRFNTEAGVARAFGGDSPRFVVRGTEDSQLDEDFPAEADLVWADRSVYVETKPHGAEQVRHAAVQVGDTLAVIIQSRRGTAPAVPFRQTVTLQSQLLG